MSKKVQLYKNSTWYPSKHALLKKIKSDALYVEKMYWQLMYPSLLTTDSYIYID